MIPDLPFVSRRSVVHATHGMVSSSQPLATQAGVDILKKGGNAADAAVAVAAAINVTEAASTGIGGDVFCLYYDAKKRTVTGLNGSGRAPAALTVEHLRKEAGPDTNVVPPQSVHAITVPGAAAAWVDTVDKFGSGKLDLATILEPAKMMAKEGFPVSHLSARLWGEEEEALKKRNPGRGNMLINNERAPREGNIIQLPELADTFDMLAKHGKEGFYKGRIGKAIVDAIQAEGGVMTLEDLAAHDTEVIDVPLSLEYHDWTIWEIPPNGSGITTLIALGIMEALEEQHGLDIKSMNPHSPQYLHIVIEALRVAFADTRYYVTDPQVQPCPTEKLLSKEYLKERAKLIKLDKRNGDVQKGYPEDESNTVYFSVVDGEGNACSFINSNFMHFGSHIVPEGCGFALHNRGANFVLIENHPNCIGPSKRPYHTIIPSMITRKTPQGDHDLEACFGVMGGYMQPQGQVQVIMNLMHFLSNPQHALDMPRVCISPPPPKGGATVAYTFTDVQDSVVYIEDGIPQETIRQLEGMGHVCYRLHGYARSMFGRGQVIRVKNDETTGQRVLAAGSDPRGDGHSAGW
ncbi:gamma-glutamyltransferase [Lichtheimia ornata]|uniref:Gamma-glutamyltransferase n=1 Tax=Lichtheimia ornata TaxID=688661 RepID=A0AAD7UTL0_9FUNG|nr:gamma-glutamyltransferase [Lichtheimia ornata]KAJ8652831.1 gamma-glutamyltransferase [Lichtheimia ornata]